jgi:hypothetical protein
VTDQVKPKECCKKMAEGSLFRFLVTLIFAEVEVQGAESAAPLLGVSSQTEIRLQIGVGR